ncbi:hypothetical protein GGX14DRAFT_571995 [Mycena pura]|uniref:Uncharacterized protein n=1 Tax=Mycena pura TaxID=153505 RepID=A0AAD6V1V1_9AGAR|nr:hypothetical protein GGX14DRAFT_571995 [Mycena pura]
MAMCSKCRQGFDAPGPNWQQQSQTTVFLSLFLHPRALVSCASAENDWCLPLLLRSRAALFLNPGMNSGLPPLAAVARSARVRIHNAPNSTRALPAARRMYHPHALACRPSYTLCRTRHTRPHRPLPAASRRSRKSHSSPSAIRCRRTHHCVRHTRPPPARFPLPTAVARLLSAARRTRCTLYSARRKLHAPTALRRQDSPHTLLFGRYIHTHSQPLRRYVLALAVSAPRRCRPLSPLAPV